eukprot:CAMPEP_0172566860 /NCGR_PEP_ID=MMETSP1067-20121228/113566_1 /TAXON_ID=265564 ORGANISM="Thalassiosira punctigera, Strain Tpunct2005C2" /NCGR_SAMPLE_ID=MMETSP1067 /ASSEMBLY_ACC=CAM_ASM_000444 /LENGTH=47 /DNA_ID= /DNA_START= /DNA_END= /DNA_ORIENTATION=
MTGMNTYQSPSITDSDNLPHQIPAIQSGDYALIKGNLETPNICIAGY